ncbi:PD-(D/E)XK nuclease family protein, partial [Crocinitomix catalasitica]|nr:PD-(D/E)XK nuclease family protein [Crocinitomix catalasitica]
NALFICGKAKLKRTNISSKWLLPFLIDSSLFKDNDGLFIYGEIEQNKNRKTDSFSEFFAHFSEGEMHKPVLSFKRSYGSEIGSLDAKKEYGNKVHLVLSQLNSQEDLAPILEKELLKGTISEEEVMTLSGDIEKLFKNVEFAAYFEASDVKNELRIVDSEGKTHIPDKVIFNKDEIIVVDFKTGKKTPAHFEQLQSYVDLLKELGYEKVSGELYYIAENERVLV